MTRPHAGISGQVLECRMQVSVRLKNSVKARPCEKIYLKGALAETWGQHLLEMEENAEAVEYVKRRGGKVIRCCPDDETISQYVAPISTVTAQLGGGVHVILRDKWDSADAKKSVEEIDIDFELSPNFVGRVIAHLMVSAFESVTFEF